MPARPPVTAIVPMKPLADSKTRLSGYLDPAERARLSAVMLDSTLTALRDSAVARVIVVGGDDCVRTIAQSRRAHWTPDRFNDLNLAVGDAIATAQSAGQSAMYVPADLPLLAAADINDALRFHAQRPAAITICPARDGGTNCLIVPPNQPFAPQLGRDSHAKHRALAARLCIEIRDCQSPAFHRDVDTIEDLRHCIQNGARFLEQFINAKTQRREDAKK